MADERTPEQVARELVEKRSAAMCNNDCRNEMTAAVATVIAAERKGKDDLRSRLEEAEVLMRAAQDAHTILSAGIKAALELVKWPDFHALYGPGLFSTGVTRLLQEEVAKLRERAATQFGARAPQEWTPNAKWPPCYAWYCSHNGLGVPWFVPFPIFDRLPASTAYPADARKDARTYRTPEEAMRALHSAVVSFLNVGPITCRPEKS